MLHLRNLVDMLQRDCANDLFARVVGTADSVLDLLHSSGLQEQPRRSWRTEVEGERSIWSYSNSGRDRNSRSDVRCSSIEFLVIRQSIVFI